MTARVHGHRSAKRAGNSHRPFEADDALFGEPPSRDRKVETGARVDDDTHRRRLAT